MMEREKNTVTINGGDRKISPLGDQGAIVLFFESVVFPKRWKYFIDNGCSWDYDSYHCHVSICYQDFETDISKIEPYRGKLIFGPEIFSEVDDGWVKKYREEE